MLFASATPITTTGVVWGDIVLPSVFPGRRLYSSSATRHQTVQPLRREHHHPDEHGHAGGIQKGHHPSRWANATDSFSLLLLAPFTDHVFFRNEFHRAWNWKIEHLGLLRCCCAIPLFFDRALFLGVGSFEVPAKVETDKTESRYQNHVTVFCC